MPKGRDIFILKINEYYMAMWEDKLPSGYTIPKYDCIAVIIGHSRIILTELLYAPMPFGSTILTGLAASPGTKCIANTSYMKRQIEQMFARTKVEIDAGLNGLFKAPPQVVLKTVIDTLKTANIMTAHLDKAAVDAFMANGGIISKNPNVFYNRTWTFEKASSGEHAVGYVLLITSDASGVHVESLYEDQIRDGMPVEGSAENGDYKLSKQELLIDLFSTRRHRHPFILDLGCSRTVDNVSGRGFKEPITFEQFIENGIFGGTRRKKSRRSKKRRNIRIKYRQ
jgi:hypothetical protein